MSENKNKSMGQSRNEDFRDVFIKIYTNYIEKKAANEDITDNVIEPFLLNILSFNDNSVKLIFDQVNFKILDVSKNFEDVTGLKEEVALDLGNLLTHFTPNCLKFLQKTAECYLVGLRDRIAKNYNSFQISLCGLSIVDKNGRTNRLLAHYTPYQFNEIGHSKLAVITLLKINFMLKSDIMWSRLIQGENAAEEVSYISNEDLEYKNKDILSERELEILKCLAEGMDTEEIAKALFISPHTIKNHRKNMLARTGSCDTTALIQICRACRILK